MDSIIEVKNLGKCYNIFHNRGRYVALRDVLTNVVKKPVQFLHHKLKEKAGMVKKEKFWALDNVSFEIKPGEIIGIIGHNGAGKSTLLKILSQITPPTTGEVIIDGKVGSLLEVGTGFHPELTGRENIFLNGAILGMTKWEIAKNFDKIVDFANIEKFIDTPVKYYSSGMYVRLAFSVAAHMEPDILFVDEVLAVGDAEFQKKSLGKMEEVTKSDGRTILLVSHNMSAIKNICKKCILFEAGKLKLFGDTGEVIAQYIKQKKDLKMDFPVMMAPIIIHNFDIFQEGALFDQFASDKRIRIMADFELTEDLNLFRIGFHLKNSNNDLILQSLLADWNKEYETLKKGRYVIKGYIPNNLLLGGRYLIELISGRYGLAIYNTQDRVFKEIIVDRPIKFNEQHKEEKHIGLILANPEWTLEKY